MTATEGSGGSAEGVDSGKEETDTLAVLLYHAFEADSIVLPSGATAGVAVTTDYPFDDVVDINFTSRGRLTVALRIPGWCPEPPRSPGVENLSGVCRVERQICSDRSGCRTRLDPCRPSGFFRTVVQSGTGYLPTAMRLHLPMHVRLENRTRNGTAVHRGERARRPAAAAVFAAASFRLVMA